MGNHDIYYADETPAMLEAFKQAQSSFKYFWREMWWERRRIVPCLDLACVKAAFRQQDASGEQIVEYMWLNDIDFDGIQIKGLLINEPGALTTIKKGDFVEIRPDEISDWLLAINGKSYGGFTIQQMRSEMNEEERTNHDQAWGLDFGNPDEILLVYEQDKHPENLIEHPMSQNMAERLRDFITQNPDQLTNKDERGYTMLHWESIAGNKYCVEALLQMGADAKATTNDGYTAADFAKRLAWEHLYPIF